MVAGGGRHWHMLNLDGAHTLQAELRSLHRKPRGYVEEGAEAEDLLAVEAEVQPKPARQTSLAGFFGASRKPAASCSNATATAAAAADTDAAAAAAAEEEPPEAEGEEAEPAWVASGGKTLEVLDELAVQPVKDTGLASPQLAAPGTQCNADGLTWACVGCCRSPVGFVCPQGAMHCAAHALHMCMCRWRTSSPETVRRSSLRPSARGSTASLPRRRRLSQWRWRWRRLSPRRRLLARRGWPARTLRRRRGPSLH